MEAVGAPWPAAVGVSGGSDSLALFLLLSDWARSRGLAAPIALCVDHGVRPESAAESRKVVDGLRKTGVTAHVLKARETVPSSDVEAACRRLRYRLLGAWSAKKRLRSVFVAHTQDDQAETVLLRLARGSGVDGLSGMQPVARYPDPAFPGLSLVRPLLGFSRQELRDYLEDKGQRWVEDPMNADPRFARVRVRNAWPQLEEIGLTPARLAETAAHLGRAREALDAVTLAVFARAFAPSRDGIALDPVALGRAPRELALRALARVLMLVGCRDYRPRFERLTALFESISTGALKKGRTLHGCRIAPATGKLAVFGGNTLVILAEKTRQTVGKTAS
jgi:tRNA(Ile)-lysidine synthase